MPRLAAKRQPKPAPEEPPPWGVDERATWAAYVAALWGAKAGERRAPPAERPLPGAA
jgi:hypothetical protein